LNTPATLPSLRLGPELVVEPALLLAPMEGVTDPSFRGMILDANPPGSLGAACSEFLRVTGQPARLRHLQAHLGPPRREFPVGLQLMGNQPEVLATSAALAPAAGAAFVDLNFGCPSPRVCQHRAGSALLEDPPLLQRLVAAVVRACPLPVTAKIRAGGADDRRLEEIARRVEEAGAAALTVHARLRRESWRQPADWRRIARAVAAVTIPVIGNGGADTPERVDAMFAETGCAGVMVGRGALANPWIFGAWLARRRGQRMPRPGPAEVAAWIRDYAGRMASGGTGERAVLGRVKQILKALVDARLLPRPERLPEALRGRDLAAALMAVGLPAGGGGPGAH